VDLDVAAQVSGAGRGYGPPASSPASQLPVLRDQADRLERALNGVRDRISEIEGQTDGKK